MVIFFSHFNYVTLAVPLRIIVYWLSLLILFLVLVIIDTNKDSNEALDQEEVVPKLTQRPVHKNEFDCPITLSLMIDPVIASDGFSYEREFIQEWIDRDVEKGKIPISPQTQLNLQHNCLISNRVLLILINQYRLELEPKLSCPTETVICFSLDPKIVIRTEGVISVTCDSKPSPSTVMINNSNDKVVINRSNNDDDDSDDELWRLSKNKKSSHF